MCAHNFILQRDYWKKYITELESDKELKSICNKTLTDWDKMNHPELEGNQGANMCW